MVRDEEEVNAEHLMALDMEDKREVVNELIFKWKRCTCGMEELQSEPGS